MSAWSPEPLVAYARSRYPAALFGPVALALAAAGLASGRPAGPLDLAAEAALAFTLVFQFRLWDDLADLPRDRAAHPERVLARAPSLAPFRALLVGAGLLNASALTLRPDPAPRLLAFAALNLALLLWYGLAHGRAGTLARHYVPLVKYPVVVFLASGPAAGTGAPRLPLAMLAAFAAACAVEALHDPAARPRGGRP